MNLLQHALWLKNRDQIELWDDFVWYLSPHVWTNLAADAGVTAFAISDASAAAARAMASELAERARWMRERLSGAMGPTAYPEIDERADPGQALIERRDPPPERLDVLPDPGLL